MTTLNGIALVTGSSGGLGRSIAIALARAGMDVALHGHRNLEPLEALRQEIEALGRRALIAEADIREADMAQQMVERVAAELGPVDVLANVAGISRDGVVWRMPPADWDDVLRTNLTGAFHCTRAVLPAMRQKEAGRIVNISSIVGQVGVPGTSAYAASKAALSGFTRTVAREVASKRITANVLALGYFSAGMINSLPAEARETIRQQIPVGHFGDPAHLGEIVVFLCSDAASYITGQTINVNGGMFM